MTRAFPDPTLRPHLIFPEASIATASPRHRGGIIRSAGSLLGESESDCLFLQCFYDRAQRPGADLRDYRAVCGSRVVGLEPARQFGSDAFVEEGLADGSGRPGCSTRSRCSREPLRTPPPIRLHKPRFASCATGHADPAETSELVASLYSGDVCVLGGELRVVRYRKGGYGGGRALWVRRVLASATDPNGAVGRRGLRAMPGR